MGFFEVFALALAGFYSVIPSFGIAIILLTLAVRVLLLPLSIKQTRSQREMQRLMPEIKAIQKKHKGDRQKINEATMALYKEHGVNPFGGCFPLLLQMPVLIALFYVIRSPLRYMGFENPPGVPDDAIVPPDQLDQIEGATGFLAQMQDSRLAQALTERALDVNQFLGLRLDCGSSHALRGEDPSKVGEICGTGFVDAIPYLLLVAFMGLSTWYMQKQLQARQSGASDMQAQQMQLMARIMPAFLMFVAFSFPTGVVLYWLTTNVWTIAQQRLMLRVVPPEATGEGNGAGAKPDKVGKAPPPKSGNGRDGRASKKQPAGKKKKR